VELLSKTFICPHCFERSCFEEVKFRCVNDAKRCEPEPDDKYSEFLGLGTPRMMAKTFGNPAPTGLLGKIKSLHIPRSATCSHCGEISTKRICPSCHSELPHTIGDFQDMIFSIVGAKESGKSHYIAVLLNEIMNSMGGAFNCNLQPANDNTSKRYREDFYNPIFRRRETIQGTRSARADFSVRQPLVYTLSFMGRGMFGKKKIAQVVTISFFDTAGEDLNSEDTILTENKYIFHSSGIIFLLDPLQLPVVRAQLPEEVKLPVENTELEEIISRTARLIRTARNMKQDQLIDIPVAVAFSKIDALDPLLDPSSPLKYPSKHEGEYNVRDFESIDAEVRSHIMEWKGEYLIQQLELNFKDYGFFALTALGSNPHGSNRISKLRPYRVADAFLWLLWKRGLIRAGKKH